jgi:large subunit ribosomal protein L31
MNATIHPQYFKTLVRCSNCGAEHELGSARERLSVDICSACHPFYTGTEYRASQGGQIARFEARKRLARTA